ncbi:DUF3149 domain-containing protein [Cohnella lubricantis]|nr:putative flippase GtrA [Cohnella lubricantis]
MNAFISWVNSHVVTSILIIGVVFAVTYVFSNRKSLFWKE